MRFIEGEMVSPREEIKFMAGNVGEINVAQVRGVIREPLWVLRLGVFTLEYFWSLTHLQFQGRVIGRHSSYLFMV